MIGFLTTCRSTRLETLDLTMYNNPQSYWRVIAGDFFVPIAVGEGNLWINIFPFWLQSKQDDFVRQGILGNTADENLVQHTPLLWLLWVRATIEPTLHWLKTSKLWSVWHHSRSVASVTGLTGAVSLQYLFGRSSSFQRCVLFSEVPYQTFLTQKN